MSAKMTVDVKIGKKIVDSRVDTELAKNIKSFVDVKKELDSLNEVLKGLKSSIEEKARYFLEDYKESSVVLIAADSSLKVVFGWDVSVSNEALLVELLGDRFDDLVTTKVSYAPTQKLKEMALEDDGLKECLSVKEKAAAFSVVK